MWNSFVLWLHHIFNPHCDECAHEKVCVNCDLMRQLLEDERRNNQRLLEVIAPTTAKEEPVKPDLTAYKPRQSWKVVRETLEQNSRAQAQAQKRYEEELKKAVQSAEVDLGIDEEADVTN